MIDVNSKANLIKLIKNKVFNSRNNELQNKVMQYMTTPDKYSIADYMELVVSPNLLDQLCNEELLWFAQAIESVNNSIIKVKNYFTGNEIELFRYYSKDKIDIKKLLMLHSVSKLAERQYTCIASVSQLGLMKRHRLIRAIPEAQRQSKVKLNKEGTEVLRHVEISPKRVNAIKELIVSDKFCYNTIRINLIDDGENVFKYNDNDNTIILPKNGDIIIPDGNHRCLACEKAISKHTEMEELFDNRFFQIAFTFFDIDTVKQCISQEWKAASINHKHKAVMERNYANRIVESIKRSQDAEKLYKDYIVTTGREVNMGTGFIIHSILAKAIDTEYKVNSFNLNSQANEVTNWLVEFFNYLTEILVDDFKNYKSVKKFKWTVNPLAWAGYVFLSKELKNNINWKTQLKNVISQIDWNKINVPCNERYVKITFEKALGMITNDV